MSDASNADDGGAAAGPNDGAADNVLLQGLDPTQRSAVTSDGAPLAILAGAGSGKTRVLTRRIAWRASEGSLDPRHVLAVTFTRKAASELRTRLRDLGLRDVGVTGTFHAIAYAQLRQRWDERGIRPPELLDRKIGFVARLVPRGKSTLPLDATAELEWVAARALTAETYPAAAAKAGRTPPIDMPQMVDLIARYADEKRKRRMVDFDDLLALCVRDLTADPEYAAAIQWRHRHLFVDEFQDINPLQYKLLSAWLGDRLDLCVVGDPNQAIYAWNGADASHLLWFKDRFPSAEIVQLGHNYRSTPEIVAAGHAVLPSNARSEAAPEAHRAEGPAPTIRSFATDVAEAAGIARSVRDAHAPGSSWGQQAILVRTNSQTVLIAAALTKSNVPHRVRGGANLIDQAEVKELIAILRGQATLLREAIDDLRAEVLALAPSGDDPSAADLDRQANREALLRMASDHADATPDAKADDFVAWLYATARSEGLEAASDAVEILTFHAAKGLEWRTVHIAGLERGFVPISYADTPAELAEERRLLHVALTRAEQALHLTWANERTFGERSSKRTRSPYVDALDPNTPTLAINEPGKARDGLGSVKSRLKEPLPVDDPLYEALVEWRRGEAKEQEMPAYIIFNNKTLAAIVDQRPTSTRELLAVSGIGPTKVDRYGDAILRIVSQTG